MSKVKGRGSIIKLEEKPRNKCRKWKLQVSLGKDPRTGEYQRYQKRFTGTYSEAEEELTRITDGLNNNSILIGEADTFGEYADAWLKRREGKYEPNTLIKNDSHIKCLNMHLKHVKLKDLTPDLIEDVYQKLKDGETPSGKPASGTYINNISKTFKIILKNAIEDGKINSNPATKAKAPEEDTKEKRSLDFKKMLSIVDKLDPTDPIQLVVLICIKTGMRRCEAHGLKWGTVKKGAIDIKYTVDRLGYVKEKTKTKASTRVIPLPTSLAKDLRKRKDAMKKQGLPTDDDSLIICNELGEPIKPHATTNWFSDNRARLGIDGWTLHELRHSYLSELARRGANVKAVQAIAGHSRIATTMEIYVHADMKDKKKATSLLDF